MKRLLALAVLLVAADLRAQNAAYVELGGNAILPSINYERRINERWSGRAGLSYVVGETTEDTEHTLIIPLTLSWISHPSSKHHFEVGGGLTIVTGDSQDLFENVDDDEKFSKAFGTGILGYRYQKPDGGLIFRAGVTPLIGDGEVLPWLGVSVGYSW